MPDVTESIVIVGGGLAGAKTAEALRDNGYTGSITLVGAENHLPYERPPLSKSYLAAQSEFDEAIVHPAEWYDENNVTLRRGVRATAIDARAHQVTLDDGTELGYDKLLLATGALPRRLSLPGADAEGVLYLRSREDSDAIRATFGAGRRLVVIGAGWIGLEVAAAARQAGTEVTVVEMAELPLLAVLGPELAQVFADLHRRTASTCGWARRSRRSPSTAAGPPACASATGRPSRPMRSWWASACHPNVALAEAAGLAIDNGVLVDAALRTSDPDIYAVGDIANHDHPTLGMRIRVEHWATALNQPTTAAAAMLGQDVSYTELPYFYSDQYDLGMEYIGHAPKGSYARVVVRGDLATREFVAFWLDDADRIKASMNVNVWDVVDEVKPLIADGTVVDPVRLADPNVPYADLSGG